MIVYVHCGVAQRNENAVYCCHDMNRFQALAFGKPKSISCRAKILLIDDEARRKGK